MRSQSLGPLDPCLPGLGPVLGALISFSLSFLDPPLHTCLPLVSFTKCPLFTCDCELAPGSLQPPPLPPHLCSPCFPQSSTSGPSALASPGSQLSPIQNQHPCSALLQALPAPNTLDLSKVPLTFSPSLPSSSLEGFLLPSLRLIWPACCSSDGCPSLPTRTPAGSQMVPPPPPPPPSSLPEAPSC